MRCSGSGPRRTRVRLPAPATCQHRLRNLFLRRPRAGGDPATLLSPQSRSGVPLPHPPSCRSRRARPHPWCEFPFARRFPRRPNPCKHHAWRFFRHARPESTPRAWQEATRVALAVPVPPSRMPAMAKKAPATASSNREDAFAPAGNGSGSNAKGVASTGDGAWTGSGGEISATRAASNAEAACLLLDRSPHRHAI